MSTTNTRQALSDFGVKILDHTRTELYLSMRFMGAALSGLDYVMDLSTTSVGTDAAYIRFNPNFLRTTFIERPRFLPRIYMHMLMHCLFRHMFGAKEHDDVMLWDLSCDIAVESVIDSMDVEVLARAVSDRRQALYSELEREVGVLTAEKIYQYLLSKDLAYATQLRIMAEFSADDHSFWERLDPDDPENKSSGKPDMPQPQSGANHNSKEDHKESEKKPPKNLRQSGERKASEDDWKKNAECVKAEMQNAGKEASDKTGKLTRILLYSSKRRTDYREFLKKFSVIREEATIDPDSFDLGFYNYGMERYGNMPLIEENEFREAKRVDELVIAIDTSASCQSSLVQKFLNETADLLLGKENFFRKVNIHIVSCDDKVQADTVITSPEQMRNYASGFTLKGGFGTDFRPVFSYVEELRKRGEIKHLRGLMYFTDGFGIYPRKATDYETAFVFRSDEESGDGDVPGWALKLYI